MRIITGSAKGYKIKAPTGLTTRPTSDRVKESIFNIIQNYICESVVVDLFAGSGNLGIEALSRNAQKTYFIDKNKDSIRAIKENLKNTELFHRGEVLQCDIVHGLEILIAKKVQAHIIFMDPPYLKKFIEPVIQKIEEGSLLADNGVIVVEHDKKDIIVDEVGTIIKYRTNYYGNTGVSFYREKEEA